jgi:hypothetical protein
MFKAPGDREIRTKEINNGRLAMMAVSDFQVFHMPSCAHVYPVARLDQEVMCSRLRNNVDVCVSLCRSSACGPVS